MRRETFRYLEAELRDYPQTVYMLQTMTRDLLSRPSPGVIPVFSVGRSDPTGRQATALLSHRLIQQAQRITQAISAVWRVLDSPQKRLIRLRYWRTPPASWAMISAELKVSESTCRWWRKRIIDAIAEELGMC